MPPEMRTASRGICCALRRLNKGVYWAMGRIKSLLWQMLKGPSEGWVTFILLLLSVILAVWSVGSVQWVPTPGLYWLALFGVVLGLLLAKVRFNGWLLAISGLLLGIYLSFYQLTSLVEGATSLDRYAEVGNRLFIWGQAFVSGNVSPDTLPFSFFLLFASWLAGFICSWSFFRRHNIWGAVLPSGILIVINLTNLLPGAQRLPLYLYLFVVCLLVARLFVLEREQDWDNRSVKRFPPDLRLLPNAFRFALVVVIVTCLLPTTSVKVAPVAAVWDRVSSPVRVIGEEFARSVGGVPAKETNSGHSFGPTQPFGGSTTVGEESVLIVEAPFPIYLRARSYDVYTHKGWETGDTQMVSPELAPEQGLDEEFQKSQEVEVSVTALFSLEAGEPVYLGGHPVDMSIDYQLEVPQPAGYRISLAGSEAELAVEAESLPLDLREAVWRLREMNSASHDALTESDIRFALPEDVWVVSWEYGIEGIETFTVERHVQIPADTVLVRTTGPVSAGDSYRATVSVSTATESDLLAAGTGYPGWILDRYLQLPDTLPSRVVDLAQELTRDIETPYEKAVAIRDYLRTLEYTLDIEAPPDGTDGVDYFLFELEKGYCQYFASAMIVLLRVSGVPSRMVAGYGPGEPMEQYGPGDMMGHPSRAWQDLQGMFAVRNSHSWTEVFFPGYGWISFEPTPVHPLIARREFGFPPQDAEGTGDSTVKPDGEGTSDSTVKPDGMETGSPWNVRLLGISLGLALFGVIIWLGWRRLLGQVSEPRVAYARIGYLAALSGVGPRENLTPQEYGHRLAAAVPEMSAALDKLVYIYVRVSYSKHNLNSEDRSNIAKAWPQVRNHLLRRALHSALPFKFYSKRSES
ncbi:MAG: transglutaminase domain-containing protein [Dehalococcoidia bacterium]